MNECIPYLAGQHASRSFIVFSFASSSVYIVLPVLITKEATLHTGQLLCRHDTLLKACVHVLILNVGALGGKAFKKR